MELWDLYDRKGNRTGEVWERRHGNFLEIPMGRYQLVSDVLVQHRDGTFLLCKRHTSKDVYPGYWEAGAGGSALQGENAEECARRELFEETGLTVEKLELINILLVLRVLEQTQVHSMVLLRSFGFVYGSKVKTLNAGTLTLDRISQ